MNHACFKTKQQELQGLKDRSRAAIMITNQNMDAVLINQICDRENMGLELK